MWQKWVHRYFGKQIKWMGPERLKGNPMAGLFRKIKQTLGGQKDSSASTPSKTDSAKKSGKSETRSAGPKSDDGLKPGESAVPGVAPTRARGKVTGEWRPGADGGPSKDKPQESRSETREGNGGERRRPRGEGQQRPPRRRDDRQPDRRSERSDTPQGEQREQRAGGSRPSSIRWA